MLVIFGVIKEFKRTEKNAVLKVIQHISLYSIQESLHLTQYKVSIFLMLMVAN